MGKPKEKKNEYICKCYKITKDDLKSYIKEGITDYKELQKRTKIGKSCSSCKKKAKKKFEKYKDKYA